jgi:hypothetical protein
MHTCLTVTTCGSHEYVEREASGLINALGGYCDSIRSCDIHIAGPSDDAGGARWRVEVRLNIFDETVRATALAPAGNDPQQSLSRVLADIYASARRQLAHIAEQHHGCCAQCAPVDVALA